MVFVGNLTNRTLKKYYVSYERELGQVMLYETSTSTTERSALNAMATSRENLGTYLSGPGVVPSEITNSGYNLLGRSYLQNQVINWYANNESISLYVRRYISDGLNMLGIATGVAWNIEVRFNDGTTAWFRKTMDRNYEGEVRLELTRVFDKDFNDIPLSADGFEGKTFSFEDESVDLDLFLQAAFRMGVPVVRIEAYIPSSGGGTTITDIQCELDGGQIKCAPLPNNSK